MLATNIMWLVSDMRHREVPNGTNLKATRWVLRVVIGESS